LSANAHHKITVLHWFTVLLYQKLNPYAPCHNDVQLRCSWSSVAITKIQDGVRRHIEFHR